MCVFVLSLEISQGAFYPAASLFKEWQTVHASSQDWRLSCIEGKSPFFSSSSLLCSPPLHPSFNIHLRHLLSLSLAFHSSSLPESPPRPFVSTSPLSSALLSLLSIPATLVVAQPVLLLPALPSNLVSAPGEAPRISIIWKWMSKSGIGINVCTSLKLLWATAAKSIWQRQSGVRGAQRTTRAGRSLRDMSF